MKLLRELREEDLGIKPSKRPDFCQVRLAVRAVVFDSEGNVAVSYAREGDYWKISGGGVEEGESLKEALRRECREEAGVNIEIEGEIGVVIEYRDLWEQVQISYCYKAKVVGEKYAPEYDEGEQKEGFSNYWISYEEALEKFGRDISGHSYEAKFMQTRDGIFLRNAK